MIGSGRLMMAKEHALPYGRAIARFVAAERGFVDDVIEPRSEEHTSELQSRLHLVCRLLLEKKKRKYSSVHQRHLETHMKTPMLTCTMRSTALKVTVIGRPACADRVTTGGRHA